MDRNIIIAVAVIALAALADVAGAGFVAPQERGEETGAVSPDAAASRAGQAPAPPPPPPSSPMPMPEPLYTGESPEEQRRCLALTLYHEARAESDDGLLAVGHVVVNRVRDEGFPDTVCGVIFDGGESAPCQFGWYCDGRPDTPYNTVEFDRARTIAERILRGEAPDPTDGAVSFHADHVSPYWSETMHHTATIGRHRFYRPVN